MIIGDLLAGLPHRWLRGEDDQEIAIVTHDSRQAGPGAVFVAVKGFRTDGLRYAPEALGRGAAAIVVGAGRDAGAMPPGASRLIEVEDERVALAVMARNLHGRVDETLRVVGVTGTNGKTTTCRVLATMLEAAGVRTGLLGTVGHRLGGEEIAADRTTPEAPDIHRYLAAMKSAGCGACVMEVSSHSLALSRVHGMRFAAAVFTNLTRDHLDYHGDMERYFGAKAQLFDRLRAPAVAVVNVDDLYGRRLADELAARAAAGEEGVGLMEFGETAGGGIRIAAIETGTGGSRVALRCPEGVIDLRSPLLGRPNGYNVAAAAAAARALGAGWDAIARGAAGADPVPGRMEPVRAGAGQRFSVIVDYAHTDDALRSLLETVRPLTAGRLIVVFGCGGDRDRTKRPLMGGHAARLADEVFVTSDNPRGEPPAAIIDEILGGIAGTGEGRVTASGGRVHADPDRRRSIEAAIGAARPGDTVVIAGKGHETYQIIGDRVEHFDDREVALAALQAVVGQEGADGP